MHWSIPLEELDQLQLKYDKANSQDIADIRDILNRLDYPSTKRAILHMQSERLGTLDIKNNQKKKQKNKQKPAKIDQHKQLNSPPFSAQTLHSQHHIIDNSRQQRKEIKAKYCSCCGLKRQEKTLSIFEHLDNIQNLGIATKLFFIAYQHVFVLMLLFFLIYSIYAIISNVSACQYRSQNLQPGYREDPSYIELVHQWIFAVSLHANLLCSQGYSFTCEIQCWIGIILMFTYIIVITVLKIRKVFICAMVRQRSKSIADFTILINNLPTSIDRKELELQLREYQKSINDPDMKYAESEIKIVKINRAAPYYLSLDTFKDKEIVQAQQSYDEARNRLVALILDRRKHATFTTSKPEREIIFKQFEQSKLERIQAYKRVALANMLIQNKNKVINSPAFVTFHSTYNKQFMLRTYKKSNRFYKFGDEDKPGLLVKSRGDKIVKKYYVEIANAPEPEEVIWTNLGQSRRKMFKKRLGIFIINLFFLFICFGVSYGLQLYDFNYSIEHEQNPSSSLGITILVTLVIVGISYVISYFLIELTVRERNITIMHEQRSLQHKYVQSCIANYLIAPLIFSLIYTPQFTGIATLAQTVFILAIDNAFFFPLLGLLDPLFFIDRISKWYYNKPTKKLYLNQRQLNAQTEYMQFYVGLQFAYAINSFIFTCFYAPLQPIIVAFSIVGIFSMYWIEKHIVFSRCCRPVPGNQMVNISTHHYLILGPVAFGIGCLVWPYYITGTFVGLAPSIIIIVLAVLLFLFPFQQIIHKMKVSIDNDTMHISIVKEHQKQQFYSDVCQKFKYDYDRLNYMTAKQAMRKYIYENYFLHQINMCSKKQSQEHHQVNPRPQPSPDHNNNPDISQSQVLHEKKNDPNTDSTDSQNEKYVKQSNLPIQYTFKNRKTKMNMHTYNMINAQAADKKLQQQTDSHLSQKSMFESQQLHLDKLVRRQPECQEQKQNYEYYYNYNDDEQVLIYEVLEHLKHNFLTRYSINDDNYTDVNEAYEKSGREEQISNDGNHTW